MQHCDNGVVDDDNRRPTMIDALKLVSEFRLDEVSET